MRGNPSLYGAFSGSPQSLLRSRDDGSLGLLLRDDGSLELLFRDDELSNFIHKQQCINLGGLRYMIIVIRISYLSYRYSFAGKNHDYF